MALQSSQRLPELLFDTKKSYRILQLQFQLQSQLQFNMCTSHYTTIQRILHPKSNSTCRRQRALRVLLLHTEGKETFIPDSRKEILRIEGKKSIRVFYRTFQAFSRKTFQRHPVITDIPAFPGNSINSTLFQYLQGIHPFQHSPIRMHILHILQFLQFDWFPQKTPPSTS